MRPLAEDSPVLPCPPTPIRYLGPIMEHQHLQSLSGQTHCPCPLLTPGSATHVAPVARVSQCQQSYGEVDNRFSLQWATSLTCHDSPNDAHFTGDKTEAPRG